MSNMKHVSPQLILSCVIGYYLLIKVAGRGLTGTFDISTLREVAYLVATISVGSYLITYVFNQLLKNIPKPKIMYGVSEPIQEDEGEQEEEEEEEEDDSSDSDYVPPKTRSRRRHELLANTNATTTATTNANATTDVPSEVLDPDTQFPTPL